MANNYTTFAEHFDVSREAALYVVAMDWLLEALDRQEDDLPVSFEIEVADHDDPTGKATVTVPVTELMVRDARAILDEHEYYGTSVSYSVLRNGLYVTCEETGDIEVLVDILQAAMAEFNIRGALSIEWANTCDKLRAGEFSGGAVVITKDDTHWMSTTSWVADKCRELGIEPAHLVAATPAQA